MADEKHLIPQKYETPVLIFFIFILLVIFFNKAFLEGKIFVSPDVTAPRSFLPSMQEANHEKVFPLWVPYVFSGMPSFASLMVAGERTYDITNTIWDGINNFFSALMVNTDVAWAVLYYFFFGIGIFLLLRRLDIGKFASFFAATATIFSTGIIIWIMFGHGTKIITISFLPYIFLFTLELFKKIRLLYVIGLTLAIHLMLEGSHVQMIFYTAFALAIYFVYVFFMTLFKKKNLLPVMQTAFFLGVAGLLAFAMSSDKYMSILEYNKYSIRGTPPIVQEPGSNSQARSGLDYDYATGWSFSPEELTTFFVPSFYGFGDYEYNGPLSNNQPVRVNTYFGQMTFTDFPEYMGVITIILAVIGFFRNRKNRFVQFSLLIIIIALLISFGRNFSILFDPMFYYFPYFNSFRAPSMILVLVQIFLPILAAFGIDAIVKARESGDLALSKKVLWWGGAFVAFLLLALLMNSSLQDFYYGHHRQQPPTPIPGGVSAVVRQYDQRLIHLPFDFNCNLWDNLLLFKGENAINNNERRTDCYLTC